MDIASSLASFSVIGLRLFVLWRHRVARKEVSSRGHQQDRMSPSLSAVCAGGGGEKQSGGVRTLIFSIERARIFTYHITL